MIKQRCAATGESFEISPAEIEFIKKIAPVFDGQRFELPLPKFCPEERQRQRLAFRNLRYLHRRKCDATGKPIISMYTPDSRHTVYYSPEWWKDNWDPLTFGKEFDFSRPFFEQFDELYRAVPTIHAYVILSENCEYINGAANCRNCYLAYNMDHCEDCYYIFTGTHSTISIECLGINQCQLCYQCIDCTNCYELRYSERCVNCSASYFLRDCRRCKNCIACANLVDKEYYIFNKPASKAEYKKYCELLSCRSAVAKFRAKVEEHFIDYAQRCYFGHSNESFSGTALHHVKNSYGCFDSFEIENCLHCNYLFKSSNCADVNIFGDNSQWLYQCLATGINCTNDMFTMGCWGGSSNVLYSILVHGCNNCFGCCGMRQKRNCILNRQYSPEDYEKLAAKIVRHMQDTGEWGNYFPPSMTPFAFNRSVAFDEYPLTKAEALSRGYRWEEDPAVELRPNPPVLLDDINDVTAAVCDAALHCERTGKPFKVILPELKLYQSLGVPLPHIAPDQRYLDLLSRRGPRRLWDRDCSLCGIQIATDIPREKSEHVLCESCFADTVE